MIRYQLFCLCMFGFVLVSPLVAEGADQKSSVDRPTVVYLHTEFVSDQTASDKLLGETPDEPRGMTLLNRELVRQAMILTIDQELGQTVRDQTLRESVPENANVVHLIALSRNDLYGRWKVKLFKFAPNDKKRDVHRLWEEKPIWEKQFKYRSLFHTSFDSATPIFEVATRSDFLEALKLAGLEEAKRPDASTAGDADQIADWEARLLRVDFVAQFGVLREVHQAIRTGGETPELLGLLSRGYANLGLMTNHQHSSATEVFFARAMIYSQRLMAATSESDLALWCHAYAFGLVGVHRTALKSVTKIEERQKEAKSEKPSDFQAPPWSVLIEAYLQWDRDKLIEIGDDDESLKPWGWRLHFQIVNDEGYEEDVLAAYSDAAHEIPAAYGIYACLNRFASLRAIRTACPEAMAALARWLPKNMSELDALPDSITKLISQAGDAPARRESPLAIARDLSEELRKLSAEEAEAALSWETLAFLIEEELFKQVASYMEMRTNATESSHAGAVDRLLPLVEGHRLAPYIASFRYHGRSDWPKRAKTLLELELRDPRMNMIRLIREINGFGRGTDETQRLPVNYDFTGRSQVEFSLPYGNQFNPSNKKHGFQQGNFLRACFTNSVIGTRMNIQSSEALPPKPKLKKWLTWIKDDSAGLGALGDLYLGLEKEKEAKDYYQKSLKIRPSLNVSQRLGKLFYDGGEYEKWESVIKKFIANSNDAMQTQSAQGDLVNGFASRGLWREAKPHAEQAARVWSASGLIQAARVNEKLGLWSESEKWAKAVTEAYPTHSGLYWYSWCRRTGRGDLKAARKYAQEFLSVLPPNLSRGDWVRRGGFYIMEGDLEKARDAYRKALAFYPSVSCTSMVAELSRKLDDEDTRKKVINALTESLKQKQDPDSIDKFGIELMEVFQSETIDDAMVERLEKLLVGVEPVDMCLCSFIIGQELLSRGDEGRAQKHFGRCLRTVTSAEVYYTLAGFYLSQQSGTSRPDDDEFGPTDNWPPRE